MIFMILAYLLPPGAPLRRGEAFSLSGCQRWFTRLRRGGLYGVGCAKKNIQIVLLFRLRRLAYVHYRAFLYELTWVCLKNTAS